MLVKRGLLAVFLTVAVLLWSAIFVVPAVGEESGTQATVCRNVSVPTTVGGQDGAVAGTLCSPPGATAVQLLVPGWTYNRGYFDAQYKPEMYSYARAANKAGYATLAIDRLGSGASLHPSSASMTFEADIRTVHEVVGALRNGRFGTRYTTVLSAGHSLGSAVVAMEAGRFKDIDALITTGWSHGMNYSNTYIDLAGHDQPASSTRKFAALGLDPLYWTSQSDTRGEVFTTSTTLIPAWSITTRRK